MRKLKFIQEAKELFNAGGNVFQFLKKKSLRP